MAELKDAAACSKTTLDDLTSESANAKQTPFKLPTEGEGETVSSTTNRAEEESEKEERSNDIRLKKRVPLRPSRRPGAADDGDNRLHMKEVSGKRQQESLDSILARIVGLSLGPGSIPRFATACSENPPEQTPFILPTKPEREAVRSSINWAEVLGMAEKKEEERRRYRQRKQVAQRHSNRQADDDDEEEDDGDVEDDFEEDCFKSIYKRSLISSAVSSKLAKDHCLLQRMIEECKVAVLRCRLAIADNRLLRPGSLVLTTGKIEKIRLAECEMKLCVFHDWMTGEKNSLTPPPVFLPGVWVASPVTWSGVKILVSPGWFEAPAEVWLDLLQGLLNTMERGLDLNRPPPPRGVPRYRNEDFLSFKKLPTVSEQVSPTFQEEVDDDLVG